MWKKQASQCNVKTVIFTKCHIFCWEVHHFSKLPLGTDITSPIFQLSLNHEFQAVLKKYESGAYFLGFKKISGPDIESTHDASIMNNKGEILLEEVNEHKYIGAEPFDIIPKIGDVGQLEKVKHLLDDVLIFKCVIKFNTIETDINEVHTRAESPFEDLPHLSKDLHSMFDTSMQADISLKVGNSVVRAHKSVLCARSSVFAKMFETSMQESEKNVIPVPDLELPILRDLVSYLYSGILAKNDFESVYALYYAADKYDVSSLRKTCSDVLLSKLEFENACRVLVLADRHSDVEFKKSTMDCIKLHFDEVLETNGWDELVKSSPLLATELISAWTEKRKKKVKTDEQ